MNEIGDEINQAVLKSLEKLQRMSDSPGAGGMLPQITNTLVMAGLFFEIQKTNQLLRDLTLVVQQAAERSSS